MKRLIILFLVLLIVVSSYFYYNKEGFDNEDSKYHINIFPEYKNYNCNKAILYENNKLYCESDNDNCAWDSTIPKYNLETISKSKEHLNHKITKLNNNVYTVGDNYYVKCINSSLFKTSIHKDFSNIDYSIHHNFVKKKDFMTIKKNNKNIAEVNYKNSIKDSHNKRFSLYGHKYNLNLIDKVDPLNVFNLFYLIKEIHRNKYLANFDKKK